MTWRARCQHNGDYPASAARLFADAAELTGPRLTALADKAGLQTITEPTHLQPTFRAALEEVAAREKPMPVVSPRLAHGLKHEWPRLGNFDISLAWGTDVVFGELKCGANELTLSACAWDAAKAAFCLKHGVGVGMLLVAAAPVDLWERSALGLELFSDADWNMDDIRRRYAAGFRKWEGDGYKPDYVYRRVRTSDVNRTDPFRIGERPWLLGVTRVEPVDDERMVWESLLPRRPTQLG